MIMLYDKKEFLKFVLEEKLLKFGDFVTKSGRKTPYFFNVGNIHFGSNLKKLADFYARFILDNHIALPTIFGPAYKGISLSISTSIALSDLGKEVAFSYNRKEAKQHGEKGNIIGRPLEGEVLIIDDVITSGMSIEESIEIIKSFKAVPKYVVVALDRQEASLHSQESAKTYLETQYGIRVYTMLSLSDILHV